MWAVLLVTVFLIVLVIVLLVLRVMMMVGASSSPTICATALGAAVVRVRWQGRDHIWLAPHDEGACWFPREIYNRSIILTHWGRMDEHHTSNTAFAADNYSVEWVDPGESPVSAYTLPAHQY